MYFKFQAKVWEGTQLLKDFLLSRPVSHVAHGAEGTKAAGTVGGAGRGWGSWHSHKGEE